MTEPKIIYEDENVTVINKPAGMRVHEDGFGTGATVVDWLLDYCPTVAGVGEVMTLTNGKEIVRPGIVHRLDRDTSGVMIVAKNQETFYQLKQQFQARKTRKIYHAILSGSLKTAPGQEVIIDLPIGRSRRDPRRRVASAKAVGLLRPALTVFRLRENICGRFAYVEAEPKTGRTHQLRAHFKAYQHPIIGDRLYNPSDDSGEVIARQALHAYQLTIALPPVGEGEVGLTKTFTAPLPDDFALALEKLKSAC
ncbi:MAG: RNA pseudouridine synthase [Candidatus Vogelbacteria bacterium CG10_big_fil_rev_8_21_14_0_10_49_38]|uniref:RNA pseudouridine synthase n=1 Tax=Candidatus Vogelbacteria bacterium CG10_big_fil_rev_8_21_14_0_10_49_38 TaxID=1975043 RepID=A0A2H0RJP3_9BACT|nr:MAG: hypothetical protein BK006_00830 [bacterium CG10_49_38]PIR46224.1 MAG: RNA pseudouridine synthase [Candidatus Vogelbacteria bacterium CG10_big_fil_rev_8_21_14_0_10_49_38]